MVNKTYKSKRLNLLSQSLDLGGIKMRKLPINLNSSLSLEGGKNPDDEIRDDVIDTKEEEIVFFIKCRIAVVKSLIFAGYSVFASLLFMGGTTLVIHEVGNYIINNPVGVLVGGLINFGASFFLKLSIELGINGKK